MEYQVIRSTRKTIGIQVTSEGEVVVRCPWRTPMDELDRVVEKDRRWIEKTQKKINESRKNAEKTGRLCEEELSELKKKAQETIPPKVRYYAEKLGVSYRQITIKTLKSRWGSCSAQKNLNFNCLLMLAPDRVIESVVVHELCHLKEMNHSERFYREVYRVMPDYDVWDRWLKTNGKAILFRRF